MIDKNPFTSNINISMRPSLEVLCSFPGAHRQADPGSNKKVSCTVGVIVKCWPIEADRNTQSSASESTDPEIAIQKSLPTWTIFAYEIRENVAWSELIPTRSPRRHDNV